MVNFNGIYKINAEVKEIVQIEDGNCILWAITLTNWFYFTFILFTSLSKLFIKNKILKSINQSAITTTKQQIKVINDKIKSEKRINNIEVKFYV
jgi:hypothetical protein